MNDITDLRSELFATMRALRDKDNPIDVAKAKAVADIAGRIIDSVKAETEYVRAFGVRGSLPASGFIGASKKPDTLMHQISDASAPIAGEGLPATGPVGRL